MLTVTIILLLASILITIGSSLTPPKGPLWVAVLLLAIVVALMVLPK